MFHTHLPTSSPGVFYGWFEKRGSGGADAAGGESSDDFLLGSGMSLFPVTLSLTTSFITAIELLGNPAEMFFSGTQFSLIGKWWRPESILLGLSTRRSKEKVLFVTLWFVMYYFHNLSPPSPTFFQ